VSQAWSNMMLKPYYLGMNNKHKAKPFNFMEGLAFFIYKNRVMLFIIK